MENIIKNQKSLMISSLEGNMEPHVSYAPFVKKENELYIYISKAANHYYNLEERPTCSVMIIEDEKDAKTVFARARVTFRCEASKVEDVDSKIFDAFDEVHGKEMMNVLRKMDFDVFKLDIKSGRLVKGFGQAFEIEFVDGEIKLNQVTGIGHR